VEDHPIVRWPGVEGKHWGITPPMSPKMEAVSVPIIEIKSSEQEALPGKLFFI
jgi:hypothetical protein